MLVFGGADKSNAIVGIDAIMLITADIIIFMIPLVLH
jgi:hypothetical protein